MRRTDLLAVVVEVIAGVGGLAAVVGEGLVRVLDVEDPGECDDRDLSSLCSGSVSVAV